MKEVLFMVQVTKIHCVKCRRNIDISSKFCPYCNSPQPQETITEQQSESNEKMQPIYDEVGNDDNSAFDALSLEAEFEDFGDDIIDPVNKEDLNDENDTPYRFSSLDPTETTSTADDPLEESSPSDIPDTLQKTQVHREKIPWNDETPKTPADVSDMYDAKGNYVSNYDHYYDDTVPKIADEVDRILANREKNILKIIGSIIAIFAVIVYLVITLN